MSDRSRTVATLLVATAVFLLLRTWGLGFGDPPRMIHPDERYAVLAARMSLDDLNPHYFLNPPLLTYMVFAVKQVHLTLAGEEASRLWIDAGGLFMTARWISALLGALTPLLIFGAARRLLGDTAAMVALVLAGFSFLHGRDSHYGVNDVTMVFFVATSLYASVRAWSEGGARWLVLGAVAAGLAAATKYNGAIAALQPVAAVLLRRPAGELRPARLIQAAGLLLLAVAAFTLANPFMVLAPDEFMDGVRRQLAWGDRPALAQDDAPLPLLYARATASLLGWLHLPAALAGLAYLLRHRTRPALLLLTFPVLYLAGMLGKPLFYWRFVLPLLPSLALLTAAGWDWMLQRRRGFVLLLVLASLDPASRLARHDQLLTRDATWIQAADWIAEHVPPDDRVFVEGPRSRARLPGPERVITTGTERLDAIPARDGSGRPAVAAGGWLVTDSYLEYENPLGRDGRRRYAVDPGELHRRLHAALTPAAEFRPGPDGDAVPFVLDSRYSPLTGLWRVERPGHTVTIWRLEPGAWPAIPSR